MSLNFFSPLLFGLAMIALTIVNHTLITMLIIAILRHGAHHINQPRMFTRHFAITFVALMLAIKHATDIFFWALMLRWLAAGDLPNIQDALYFSGVTYTTLGYGDLVLTGHWRLICGLEAMNGILAFGWSTALMFLVVQRIWIEEKAAEHLDHRKD